MEECEQEELQEQEQQAQATDHPNGSAGLYHKLHPHPDQPHGRDDLLLRYRDDLKVSQQQPFFLSHPLAHIGDVILDDGPCQVPHACQQPVCDGPRVGFLLESSRPAAESKALPLLFR